MNALLGGYRRAAGQLVFDDPALWRTLGADGTAADTDAAVALAGQSMATSTPAP